MGRPPLRHRAAARMAVMSSVPVTLAEPLERRVLLAANPAAVARGPLAKIGTELAAAAVTPGSVTVAVEAYAVRGRGAALAQAERRLGATDVVRHGPSIHAMVPTSALAGLAALKSLRFARPDDLVTHAGSVTSQGDVADRAANARSTYGVNGSGVTVGILSDSFNNAGLADTYATDVASGDLPAGVQVLAEDPTPGTDEGRAMAQVIYDSAPGAGIAFATAEGGQAAMAANIASLVKAGAKVIVDDVSYLAEPMFQDGPVAQAVAAAVAAGVSYFSAAGETASDGYASSWRSAATLAAGAIPSAAGAPAFYGGTLFNFATDGSVNPYNAFTLAAGASLTLSFQWDSPYYSVNAGDGGATNQVDAYVLNASATQIVGGAVNYDVGGDPVQVFTYTNNSGTSTTFNLALATESGSAVPGYVKYVDFAGAATGWAYAYNSGTIYGHANAAPAGAGLEAIGSASYAQTPAFGTSPAVLEPTSATGTTPILFDTTGNRLANAVVRQAPGLVGPDRVDTTFFGTDTDGDGFPNFAGTSAAVASAAGVAALVLSKVPTLSPAALDTYLQSSALDMGPAGVDTQSGYGLIQADAAIAAALSATTGTVTGTVFQDVNGNAAFDAGEPGYGGGATVFVDANRNGTLDPGEISTKAATDGTFALANVPLGSDVIRVVVPNGTIATAASATVTVSAGNTAAGVALGLFPFVFAGTAGNDSYLLQLDATNKKNVDVTLGATTYTIALTLLSTLLFTPNAGNDTLTVSFVNGSPIPAAGITYDGGGGTNGLVITGGTGADSITVKGQLTTVNNTPAILAFNLAAEVINGNGGNDFVNESTAVATGQTLTFNGGVGATTFNVGAPLPNNGAGYVYNAGTAPGTSGTLKVQVGTYALAGDPSLTSANLTVNVSTNAALILSAAAVGTGVNTRTLAGIVLATGATMTVAAPPTRADRALVITGTLSIAGTGKLDLTGNDMVVTSGTASAVTTLAATGYAGGAWTGAGLGSSTAAADATHRTGVGVIPNSPPDGTGPLYTATNQFDGVYTPTTAAAVLVRFTYYGDANLDGTVNIADYTRTDLGYITPGSAGWVNGDFNYDNLIDGSDYTLMDNAFNTQGGIV